MENDIVGMQKAATDRMEMDTFLDKCHEKMKSVDKSAASLMNSLDLMHATTEMLVKQLDVDIVNEEEPSKERIKTIQECKRTAKELIMMLQGTVLRDKVTTVESLRSFLRFLMKNAEENLSVRTASSCYLLLEAEYSNVSNKHKEKHIQNVLLENEELHREISRLKELIRLSDDKESTFMVEKKSQNERIKNLENERDQVYTENEEKRKEHILLEANLDKAKEEIESLNVQLSLETENVQKSKTKNDELIINLQTLQAEHQKMTHSHEETSVSLQNEIESLQSQIAQLNETNESLLSQAAQLGENNTSLKSQMAQLRENNESLQSQTTQLRENIERLETDLGTSRYETKQKEDDLIKIKIEFDTSKEELNKEKTEIENEREAHRTKCIEVTHENDSIRNDLTRMKQQNNELQKNIEEVKVTLQGKEQEIERLQKSGIEFKEQFENEKRSLNTTNDELEANLVSLQKQLTEIENEECSLNDQIKSIRSNSNKQIKEQEESIRKLTLLKDVLEEELQLSKNKYKQLSENFEAEKIKYSAELEEKQKHIGKIDNILNDKDRDIAHLELEKQNLLKQQEELNSKHEELTKKTNREKENLQAELTKAETNIKRLQQKMSNDKTSYETDMYQKDTKIKELKRTNKQIHEEKDNVSKVLISVEEELKIIKSKRILQVQLYSQNRTSLNASVEQDLIVLLKEKLESEKLELEFVQCAKASDIQPDVPLLLLCITVSRLGTDVANTVQGLTLSRKMAVLIFHHKDVHALPNQDSGRVLTGHDLKTLGGVIDMAFLSGKGIYECDMNKKNVISLINFINREGVRRVKTEA